MVAIRYPLFLTAGFRFFFLGAGLWALLAMALWLFWLAGSAAGWPVSIEFGVVPSLWHAHEMVFGYAIAVVAGFFLTAVPNWTGDGSAPARFVTAVGTLWLAGRLAMLLAGSLNPFLVFALDMMFLPVLTVRLARSLIRHPKSQNMLFLLLLVLAILGNLLMHAEWTGLVDGHAGAGLRMALYCVLAMMVLIGGRVVPAFTRGALMRKDPRSRLPVHRDWADHLSIYAAILVAALLGLGLSGWLLAVASLAAFAGNAVRLSGWRSLAIRGDPLLWSLHLGFLLLVLSYLALALSALVDWPGEIAALHLAGAGAIGVMTLAMMTRASLGHTGRPLVAPAPAVAAYVLVAISAVLRVGTDSLPGWAYFPAIFAAGGFWIAAFSAYLTAYLAILAGPSARA